MGRREEHGPDAGPVDAMQGLDDAEWGKVLNLAQFMRPTLCWRVLVCPMQPRRKSAGGIALPEAVQDNEMHLQYIGRIVAIGPLAGKSERFLPPQFRDVNLSVLAQREGGIPYQWGYGEGDWVEYGQYAGMRQDFHGIRLLIVNDDELLSRIPGPEGFRIYA